MPFPEKDEKEWIEVYNENDFDVSLENWYADDVESGGSSPKIFSISIASHGYGYVELSSNMFNNSGDTVRLINSLGQRVDTFIYKGSELNISWGRDPSDEFCLMKPTKKALNAECLSEQDTSSNGTDTLTPLPSPFSPSPRPPTTPYPQGKVMGVSIRTVRDSFQVRDNQEMAMSPDPRITPFALFGMSNPLLVALSILLKTRLKIQSTIHV